MTEHSSLPDCFICQRIEAIKNNSNLSLIIELEASYVVLGDFQFYKGYTLLLSKEHTTELHFLEADKRATFLSEMALVGEAVYNVFAPHKLNYEILGNGESHLHCHIFPRYPDDPEPTRPVWIIDKAIRNAEETRPTEDERERMKTLLREQIEVLMKKN